MTDPSFKRRVDEARVEVVTSAVNRAVDASVEAVQTMVELMRTSKSDTTRLRAASAVLEIVGTQKGDPVADAIRGLRTFSGSDVADLTRRVAETAIEHLPDDKIDDFVDDLEKNVFPRASSSACSTE